MTTLGTLGNIYKCYSVDIFYVICLVNIYVEIAELNPNQICMITVTTLS